MALEAHAPVAGREVRVSSPDKVVFPEQGWTKLDVVNHFMMCSEGALRGVYNRPALLKRWPKGVHNKPMFQKRPRGARQTVAVRAFQHWQASGAPGYLCGYEWQRAMRTSGPSSAPSSRP